MKMKITALVAVLTLMSALVVACSPSSSQNTEVNTDNFVGEWEFVYGSQEELSKETVELAKSLGANAVMTLKEDGTGSFDLYGTVQNLTWSATSPTEGSLTLEENEAASMKVEDGELELADSVGQTLTFVRYVPDDEAVDAALVGSEGAGADSTSTSESAATEAAETAEAAEASGAASAAGAAGATGATGASVGDETLNDAASGETADGATTSDASSSAE